MCAGSDWMFGPHGLRLSSRNRSLGRILNVDWDPSSPSSSSAEIDWLDRCPGSRNDIPGLTCRFVSCRRACFCWIASNSFPTSDLPFAPTGLTRHDLKDHTASQHRPSLFKIHAPYIFTSSRPNNLRSLPCTWSDKYTRLNFLALHRYIEDIPRLAPTTSSRVEVA